LEEQIRAKEEQKQREQREIQMRDKREEIYPDMASLMIA